MRIDPKILDKLAQMEVDALLDGLADEEMRKNPSFLEKVRKFLQQNDLKTTPQTSGVSSIQKETLDIPEFDWNTTEVQ